MNPLPLKGLKFSRLTVISYNEKSRGTGQAYWNCICTCGNKVSVRANHLRSGDTKSCGCWSSDKGRKFLKKYANSKLHKGKGNPQWKGDKAGYQAIHQWLNRHWKKVRCEECGSKTNLDWCLKKGFTYVHDRLAFMVLCRSHHIKYDRS